MTLLIFLNVAMCVLAFGAVAAGLIIARHLGPGPQDGCHHAYRNRRRSSRRPSIGVARAAIQATARRSELLGLL